MTADSKKPTKRAKSPKPVSALEAEKQAAKEEKAARAAHAAQVSKEARAAKKAERAAAKEARAAEKAAAKEAKQQAEGEKAAKTKATARAKTASDASPNNTQNVTRSSRPKASESGVKATRRESAAQTSERKIQKPSFDFSIEGLRAWAGGHRGLVIALAVILFLLIMLYPPVQSYYCAMRTHEVLSGKLETVESDVENLSSDVSKLTSEEGLKDEARRRGYVEEGETAVDMEGVEDSGSAAADTTVLEDSQEEEVETPWYYTVLDVIFFYDPSTQGLS